MLPVRGTARVVVEPPRYRGVTVVARLTARRRVATDTLKREALKALYEYFDPIHTLPDWIGALTRLGVTILSTVEIEENGADGHRPKLVASSGLRACLAAGNLSCTQGPIPRSEKEHETS